MEKGGLLHACIYSCAKQQYYNPIGAFLPNHSSCGGSTVPDAGWPAPAAKALFPSASSYSLPFLPLLLLEHLLGARDWPQSSGRKEGHPAMVCRPPWASYLAGFPLSLMVLLPCGLELHSWRARAGHSARGTKRRPHPLEPTSRPP